MIKLVLAIVSLSLLGLVSEPAPRPATAGVRFEAVDVYVDSKAEALAAYQFELKVTAGDVTTVGVEGGEHAAFRDAPYYDPAAMAKRRIIIAAFNTGSDLPTGRTRVARVHVRVGPGERPVYQAELQVAGDAEGRKIAGATVSVVEGAGS